MCTLLCKTIILHIIFLFLLFITIISASEISYSDQCSSFVPKPTHQTLIIQPLKLSQPSFRRHIGYYSTSKTNGSLAMNFSSIETDVKGLFSVSTRLVLHSLTHSFVSNNNYFELELHGFWSKSDGKLCAFGEGHSESRGDSNEIHVLLKLFNLDNSSSITNLVTGSLESTSDLYFDPISVVLFPMLNYEYTLNSQEFITHDDEISSPGLPLESLIDPLCTLIFEKPMSLRYASRCKTSVSAKNCNPLGDLLGSIPNLVLLHRIECFASPLRLRLLIKFSSNEMWSYKSVLDPNSTLIGEGVWDSEKNRLFVVACRIKKATESWTEAQVSDCSTRLSLRFPSVWKIGDTKSIVGRVWSAKSVNDSDFFEEIAFRHSDGLVGRSPSMKYEYTMIEKAKKLCSWEKPVFVKTWKMYPDSRSNDMCFDAIGKMSGTEIISGYAEPVFVGNQIYISRFLSIFKYFSEENSTFSNGGSSSLDYPAKVSYQIILSSNSNYFDISAEGIYDVATGRLCMIGCRNIGSKSPLDCEILVYFQFPPMMTRDLNERFIIGKIESKRKVSDPLHFKPISVSSAAFVSYKARDFIRAIHFEDILIIVFNTMACIFAALQMFRLKKNSDLGPFVSVTMLVTLALGHSAGFAPAMGLNFPSQDVWDVNVTKCFLCLSYLRLLRLVWFSRVSHVDRHAIWTAEKKALLVSLLLYFGVAFVSFYVSWFTRNIDLITIYEDVLLDGFLAPQVLLNVFRDSREKPLSCFFYVGTTLVRVFRRVLKPASVSYWDVVISSGSLILAGIVYLQHKFGGHCGIFSFRVTKTESTNVK